MTIDIVQLYTIPGSVNGDANGRNENVTLSTSQHPFQALPLSIDQCPRGHGELILLVDDDSTVSFIATKILTTYGYKVLNAENGAEGIAVYNLRRNEIALVISDLMMPVMDGQTMIRRLVATNPDVRIVVVSGSLAVSDNAKFPENGVLHFLEKPYTTSALLQVVHAALVTGAHSVG